jgi:hypothetical protein
VTGIQVAVIDHTQTALRNNIFTKANIITCIRELLPPDCDEKNYLVGNGTLLDAYCRMLHCCYVLLDDEARFGLAKFSLQQLSDIVLYIYSRDHSDDDIMDTYGLSMMDSFFWRAFTSITGRSFFTTREGYVGIAPDCVEPGDVVCVLLGADTPVLLRPTKTRTIGKSEGEDGKEHWQVVGAGYVPGLMLGEAIHGPMPSHYRPVWTMDRYAGAVSIKDVTLRDERDGSTSEDPTKVLDELGIHAERYQRTPHILEVSSEELRRAAVDIREFDLI